MAGQQILVSTTLTTPNKHARNQLVSSYSVHCNYVLEAIDMNSGVQATPFLANASNGSDALLFSGVAPGSEECKAVLKGRKITLSSQPPLLYFGSACLL